MKIFILKILKWFKGRKTRKESSISVNLHIKSKLINLIVKYKNKNKK
ncbi:hypothetical protein [Clostridioides difficile]|nr:hypothetical protein [Clostridioides difficile]UUV14783.1 hypothetical protein NQ183_19720 [Clostridioides difficile]